MKTNKHPPQTPPLCCRTLPKLPLPRTLIKLKSLRVLLWICPFSLPADEEDVEEEEVVEEEEEEEEEDECWGPCWSSDSASCRRSSPAKSVGVDGKKQIRHQRKQADCLFSCQVFSFFFRNVALYFY